MRRKVSHSTLKRRRERESTKLVKLRESFKDLKQFNFSTFTNLPLCHLIKVSHTIILWKSRKNITNFFFIRGTERKKLLLSSFWLYDDFVVTKCGRVFPAHLLKYHLMYATRLKRITCIWRRDKWTIRAKIMTKLKLNCHVCVYVCLFKIARFISHHTKCFSCSYFSLFLASSHFHFFMGRCYNLMNTTHRRVLYMF